MTDLKQALSAAVEYAVKRVEIPSALLIEMGGLGILAHVKAADLSGTNAAYHDIITQSLISYFEGSGSIAGPKNAVKQACRDAFADALVQAWLEETGELTPDDDALAWLAEQTATEMGNIDSLFDTARGLRGTEGFDYFAWATARADAYTSTVLSVYNAAVLLAKGNQMLTWHLGETEKHCKTCATLDGKAHRASWYISHDYIPRKPDAAMDCHGYNCDCRLEDKAGEEVTL